MGEVATLKDLEILFGNVIEIMLGIAAVVLFVLLLSSGLKFITSGGDPKALEGAKKTLTYAIGGFIAIVISYLVLVLIKEITGVDVTVFKIVQ